MNAETDIAGWLPRWALMWLLGVALFLAAKALVRRRIRIGKTPPWPRWKTAAWYLLWPGMNVADFTTATPVHRPSPVAACAKIAAGSFLLWGLSRRLDHPLAAGWCGMTGLILLLHFGTFDLLAWCWQAVGFRASPIMDSPAASASVAEFWGRRWNSAFRDLTHPLVFAPAARRWGLTTALWLSFAVSGLVHELMISVPAGAGYGLPTAYFLMQALGITLEKVAFPRMASGQTVRANRLFSLGFTALPAFFLFHPPFVERVMLPFFHVIGALP